MKIFILALILLVAPMAAQAQTCTMDTLNTKILGQARVAFESLIRSSLKDKFEPANISKISEDLQIRRRDVKIETDYGYETGSHIDTDYILTISNIQIETAKGNHLTLTGKSIDLRSVGAQLRDDYDNEGERDGQSCLADFLTSFTSETVILNSKTGHPVANLNSDHLSVNVLIKVKAK